MGSWTNREKVTVGVIVLTMCAFVGSRTGDDGSLSAFLVFLAFILGITGIAVSTVRLFRGRAERASGRPARLGMTRTQRAILAGVGLLAVYVAADVSSGGDFVLAAFVAEFVMGLIVLNLVVLGASALRRLRRQHE